MNFDPLASRLAARYLRVNGGVRVAAGPEGLPQDGNREVPAETPEASSTKRDIPKGHEYDPKALKPLAKMLWAMSISLGHALTAYRQFTKLKSSQVSPDGKLGGRGYVMSVKDVRTKLQEACESLSSVSDTIHDEINAPHWKPQLSDMGANDAEDIKKYIEEAEKNLASPEEEAESEAEELEAQNDDDTPNNVSSSKWEGEESGEGASKIPGGGDPEVESRSDPVNQKVKQASEMRKLIRAAMRTGTSSLPVETMPGGPRVDTLDRASQTGPYGSYNEDEPRVTDEWGETDGVGHEYDYSSEWENEQTKEAKSAVPDSNTSDSDTKTDADDFGLGYGAKGEGSGGYGLQNPSNSNGVFGPASGLPNDPGGKSKGDESDAMPFRYDEKSVFASDEDITALIGEDLETLRVASVGQAQLPNDGDEPVARSDYYRGPKGNIISQAELPGGGMPAKDTPLGPRPAILDEFARGSTELPGDDANPSYDGDRDLMNTGYRFERQDNPYIKWDSSTRNYNPDYSYGRPDGSDLRPNGT